MRRQLGAALVVLGVVVVAAIQDNMANGAVAQEEGIQSVAKGSSGLPTLDERTERLGNFSTGSGQDLALPEPSDLSGLDQETAQRYQETLRAYYDYRRSGYDHRLRVFEWQFVSTIVIFLVVLLLVFAGIYFAAIQFHHGLRKSDLGKEGEKTDVTEFVFSFKEVKVRSPVLGVIVLTLSLAFFYLYLVYVYPIENVF